MRLIFIRHGDPDYEKDDLTPAGVVQAGLVAERLRDEGIEEIWTSSHGRAVNTAKFTSDLLGIPFKTVDFIREVTWGSRDGEPVYADGHPWDIADEMAVQGMNLNDPAWRENPYFKNNTVRDAVDTIETGIDAWLADHGYVRQGLYYDHVVEEDRHRTIAMFCHGGSMSAAIGHIMNLPFPYCCAMLHMNFTGVTILRFDKGLGACKLPCLELVNDVRHLL